MQEDILNEPANNSKRRKYIYYSFIKNYIYTIITFLFLKVLLKLPEKTSLALSITVARTGCSDRIRGAQAR